MRKTNQSIQNKKGERKEHGNDRTSRNYKII